MTDPGPWASGPGEILRHALKLLKNDSDTHRRLAMILIDNAVELTIKTYLGLPTRVTGIRIPREKFREISESFPKLLDAIEQNAADRLTGIDLGEVEWYHRLRNELYHQGNGLTVERQKVDVYAELAKLLFKNLFGVDVEVGVEEDDQTARLGAFISEWQRAEQALLRLSSEAGTRKLPIGMTAIRLLKNAGADAGMIAEFDELRRFRNSLVHGEVDRTTVTPELVARLQRFVGRIELLRDPRRSDDDPA